MSSSSIASGALSSIQNWSFSQEDKEITTGQVLDRLVWIRYEHLWWPAVLYDSFQQLQKQVYDQLDMVSKAQLSLVIMKQVHEGRRIKVARLLGKNNLEVVEAEEGSYCEFYWYLPTFLPKACTRERYKGNDAQFLDFHRALDHVQEIFREIGEEKFEFFPNDGNSWLAHAEHVLTQDVRGGESCGGSVSRGGSLKSLQGGGSVYSMESERRSQPPPSLAGSRGTRSSKGKSSTDASYDRLSATREAQPSKSQSVFRAASVSSSHRNSHGGTSRISIDPDMEPIVRTSGWEPQGWKKSEIVLGYNKGSVSSHRSRAKSSKGRKPYNGKHSASSYSSRDRVIARVDTERTGNRSGIVVHDESRNPESVGRR